MQNSHFSASTAPPSSFQFERPNQNELRSGSMRYDDQAYTSNKPCGMSFQSISFSSVDKYDMSSGPMERETFMPKIIDVNYIEGSGDKRWSDRNFPWAKMLEVFNYCPPLAFVNHQSTVVLVFAHLPFRPIIKRFSETIHSAPIRERLSMPQ